MGINWKRVVIAGIWSEFLLLAIYLPAKQYAGSAFIPIALLAMLGSMFLGGLWVARKVESRFLPHGVLVGIMANVVFYVLFFTLGSILMPNEPLGSVANNVLVAAIKIFGAAIGGFVGGIRRKKLLSVQGAKS
jgi:putative membrane protein (TIGR04086 family)